MVHSSSKGMFTVSVAYGPRTALIACSGPAGITEICGAVALGAEVARRTKRPRFLFDFLAVDFQGSDQDRKEMGRFAATLLRPLDRIAVVLDAAQTNGVGERAANEAGLVLCNFENLGEAMGWLNA